MDNMDTPQNEDLAQNIPAQNPQPEPPTLRQEQIYNLEFHGKGSDYFGIIIINWLLTVVTLGLYYPWAKEKNLKFLYGSTELEKDPFEFHGTGKEMFKGFIKAIGIFLALYGILFLFIYLKMPIIGVLVFYLGFIALLPIAIHGSYRYRMSRTSWRGIRFGYRGDRTELTKNFFGWFFLTIITLGIYGSWFVTNLRNYIVNNLRFGSIKFNSTAKGLDYFILNIKGYILSIFTLGIYMFWWQKDLFQFYVNNIYLEKDGKTIQTRSTATGGDFAVLLIVNFLITIFTLGLGYAWVVTRTMEFITNHIQLVGDIDLNSLNQTEENYKNATGEDIGDMLDLGFVI